MGNGNADGSGALILAEENVPVLAQTFFV